MGRQRNPNRDEAKKMWLESDGKATNKELAEAADVTESRIRKWKSEDGWKAALEEQRSKRKRGAPPGNKNAVGSGAPKRNTNALTHGAYKTIYFDELSEDEKALIEAIDLDPQVNMLRELQTLVAKENDLKKRIAALELDGPDTLYLDRVVEILVPKDNKRLESNQNKLDELIVERDNLMWEMRTNPSKSQKTKLDKLERQIDELKDKVRDDEIESGGNKEPLKTSMQTIIKASPFERALRLRAELDKTHGRIIKLLDSVKAYELESRRLLLEERKYRLAKQKLNGEFKINPETGEIDDDYDPEGIEIELT